MRRRARELLALAPRSRAGCRPREYFAPQVGVCGPVGVLGTMADFSARTRGAARVHR